ncbi:hypothetical protein TWF281_006917 [Arthrobotrys megalospora]
MEVNVCFLLDEQSQREEEDKADAEIRTKQDEFEGIERDESKDKSKNRIDDRGNTYRVKLMAVVRGLSQWRG